MTITLIDELPLDTPIYRFVDFATFIAFVETGHTYLTKITSWDDTWEAPFFGAADYLDRDYGTHESYYGQCWAIVPESDALWRIYSPQKEGIRIQSTIAKLGMLDPHLRDAIIGKVRYFADVAEFHALGGSTGGLQTALYKRKAFEHEHEIRLLIRGLTSGLQTNSSHVAVPLAPKEFVDGIMLDPRAADWKLRALESYCARFGLPVPRKSSLYQGMVGTEFRSRPPETWVSWDSEKNEWVTHKRS